MAVHAWRAIKLYCLGAILEATEFTIVLSRGYFGFYHILSSRGATLDKKLSGYKKRAIMCVEIFPGGYFGFQKNHKVINGGLLWICSKLKFWSRGATLDREGGYSSVPNKRTYLNNHTYQNFTQKPINVPTQISIPIWNLPKHYITVPKNALVNGK